jgi:phosphopantetheinyl transferase
MNPIEAEWIRTSSEPVETFTQFWTKKEAVVKLRGTGIIDDLHHVLDGEGYRLETHLNREKRYAWSVAFTQ